MIFVCVKLSWNPPIDISYLLLHVTSAARFFLAIYELLKGEEIESFQVQFSSGIGEA